jgi:vacuolar-type H+-ATPase subunit E/Vma4
MTDSPTPPSPSTPASPLDIVSAIEQEVLKTTQQQVDAAMAATDNALRSALQATAQADQQLGSGESAMSQAAQAQENAVTAAQQQAEQAMSNVVPGVAAPGQPRAPTA